MNCVCLYKKINKKYGKFTQVVALQGKILVFFADIARDSKKM